MASEVPGKEYKRFLLKVDDEFTDRVALTNRFVEDHFEIRDGTVMFYTTDGEVWEFRVLSADNGMVYLTEGWSTFVAVYDLKVGDQLQCSYDKYMSFLVKRYTKDGLEEDFSIDIEQELFADELFGMGNCDHLDSELDNFSVDEDPEDWDDDWSPSPTQTSSEKVLLFDVMEDGNTVAEFNVELSEGGQQAENAPKTLEGPPMPTPAHSKPQSSSAKGTVTSKKRAAADRFCGLVKGERLNFLAAVGSVAEDDHEQRVHATAGNLSNGTVATNVGQMIGNLRLQDDLHVQKLVKTTAKDGCLQCGNCSGTRNFVMLPCPRNRPIVSNCVVKVSLANLRRRYRLPLEFDFASDNLPFGQSKVIVHTESGGFWEIGCYRGVSRARVNKGWKQLAIDNNVHVRDMVVFVAPDYGHGAWDATFIRHGV